MKWTKFGVVLFIAFMLFTIGVTAFCVITNDYATIGYDVLGVFWMVLIVHKERSR
jgi:hypothetical protein